MKTMLKTTLLALCLLAALMLTACQTHVDNDPWPASDGSLPVTEAPAATQAPADVDDSTLAAPQPTQQTQVDTEPGLNG